DLFIDANCNLGEDVLAAFDRAIETDESPVAREVLRELKENARIARDEQSPLCQDTGLAVLFVEVGQDVHVTGGDLKEALNEGVRRGYGEGYLRKSACHPFTRANTRDNTPAVIHFDIVPGERMRIVAVPKGGGAENMSRVDMLSPSAGLEGIKDFVVKRIEASGSNPCPPTVVGVGIGGTFERSAILAKKALTRRIGQRNADPELAGVEADVLSRINRLGIGPMGYGGNTTSLDVFFEVEPCHIASLPVAVNVQCHATRHKEAIL
ncbi:MAG TPA: fumarate hydratase, partial [Syntrophales bacterium]|nr:fumarate hydratase [Syntrophales bacterium]